MKESSYHDPKMEAYCKAVWCLEDKFDGLELNHIAHKYNEVVDELSKITSSQTVVPLTSLPTTSTSPSSTTGSQDKTTTNYVSLHWGWILLKDPICP
jgi:hypothetical protein